MHNITKSIEAKCKDFINMYESIEAKCKDFINMYESIEAKCKDFIDVDNPTHKDIMNDLKSLEFYDGLSESASKSKEPLRHVMLIRICQKKRNDVKSKIERLANLPTSNLSSSAAQGFLRYIINHHTPCYSKYKRDQISDLIVYPVKLYEKQIIIENRRILEENKAILKKINQNKQSGEITSRICDPDISCITIADIHTDDEKDDENLALRTPNKIGLFKTKTTKCKSDGTKVVGKVRFGSGDGIQLFDEGHNYNPVPQTNIGVVSLDPMIIHPQQAIESTPKLEVNILPLTTIKNKPKAAIAIQTEDDHNQLVAPQEKKTRFSQKLSWIDNKYSFICVGVGVLSICAGYFCCKQYPFFSTTQGKTLGLISIIIVGVGSYAIGCYIRKIVWQVSTRYKIQNYR